VDPILRVSAMSFLRCRVLVLGGLCAALALPCFGGKVGDIVSGEIISEDNKVLVLKKDPCDSGSMQVAFSSPWKKRKMDTKTCPDGSVHDVYLVEQLPPPPAPPPPAPDDKPKNGEKPKAGESDNDRPKEAPPNRATDNSPQPPPDTR
jgi:hypothetical protein